jgi:hypothetical protein
MLTARNIKDVALEEWRRYFSWRISPKLKYLFIVACTLLVVSLPLLVVGSAVEERPATTTRIVLPTAEEIDVKTSYYGWFISAYMGDTELPTMNVTDYSLSNSNTSDVVTALAFVLMVVSLMLYLVWYYRYEDSRSKFIADCLQRWITSEFKEIPSQQSVIDFIAREK